MEIYRRIKEQAKTGADRYVEGAGAAGITIVTARLFYKSWIGGFLFFPIFFFYRNYRRRKREEETNRQLLGEFKDCLEMVAASMLAGYSLENSFVDAQQELEILHGPQGKMYKELERINRQTAMNQPIEQAFASFAKNCSVEEIENFSEILSYAKRSGGDFIRVIQGTVEQIADKISIEEEIQTIIAEKRLEQKVMNTAPLLLLLYLDITSPGYLDVLYGNPGGVAIMTLCLSGYAAAILLSERIGRIEV